MGLPLEENIFICLMQQMKIIKPCDCKLKGCQKCGGRCGFANEKEARRLSKAIELFLQNNNSE